MVERIRLPDAWAAIEHFFQQEWSDGLPVTPPTETLVRQMLDATPRDPAEVVGHVPPRFGEATVESLAAHAVLAGCLPAYFSGGARCYRGIAGPELRPARRHCHHARLDPVAHCQWPAEPRTRHQLGLQLVWPGLARQRHDRARRAADSQQPGRRPARRRGPIHPRTPRQNSPTASPKMNSIAPGSRCTRSAALRQMRAR